VEVLTNARVKEVQSDKILFTQMEGGTPVVKEIPMGFCLWSTGVCQFNNHHLPLPLINLTTNTAQGEFCRTLSKKLEGQNNVHALETDTHLRLTGAPLGDVYAIGDCATVQNNLTDHLVTFLRRIAVEKGKDPEKIHITFREWREVAQRVKKQFPQAATHLRRLDKLFEQYDKDRSGTLDFSELRELLLQIDSKLTSLPATAQRANQQGRYLGWKFNKIAQVLPDMNTREIDFSDLDEAVYKAFQYKHLGSLAYIGNAAIFDIDGLSFGGGLLAVYLWRSIYFTQSVSLRTRVLLAMDWAKRAMFGRGIL
jgi:NADH dehydrogenase